LFFVSAPRSASLKKTMSLALFSGAPAISEWPTYMSKTTPHLGQTTGGGVSTAASKSSSPSLADSSKAAP
jgi:hypothetical protein